MYTAVLILSGESSPDDASALIPLKPLFEPSPLAHFSPPSTPPPTHQPAPSQDNHERQGVHQHQHASGYYCCFSTAQNPRGQYTSPFSNCSSTTRDVSRPGNPRRHPSPHPPRRFIPAELSPLRIASPLRIIIAAPYRIAAPHRCAFSLPRVCYARTYPNGWAFPFLALLAPPL